MTRGTVNSQHTHTHTHTLVIIRMYAHRSFSMRIGHPPLRYAYLLFLRSLRSQSGFGWDRHVGPLPARPPFSSRASIRVDGKKRETKGGGCVCSLFLICCCFIRAPRRVARMDAFAESKEPRKGKTTKKGRRRGCLRMNRIIHFGCRLSPCFLWTPLPRLSAPPLPLSPPPPLPPSLSLSPIVSLSLFSPPLSSSPLANFSTTPSPYLSQVACTPPSIHPSIHPPWSDQIAPPPRPVVSSSFPSELLAPPSLVSYRPIRHGVFCPVVPMQPSFSSALSLAYPSTSTGGVGVQHQSKTKKKKKKGDSE